MKTVKFKKATLVQPTTDGASCPLGSFDTSARLDVQAAMMRNHTWNSTAWRTWDSQHAAAPEQYPVLPVEGDEDQK